MPASPLSAHVPSPAHLQVGKRGERAACLHLRALGWRILGCNVRIGRGEIDVLAVDPRDGALVFAEVKARSRRQPDFPPHLGLDRRKREALRKTVRGWVLRHAYDGPYRIDLLCVEGGRITDHVREIAWD